MRKGRGGKEGGERMEDEESGKRESSGLVFWIHGLWVEIGLEHEWLRLGSVLKFCPLLGEF